VSRRAIVVGGGIGGLASAISLTQAGWDVDVFERKEGFTEIGAGLTLWPNALAALDALGVGAEARAEAVSGYEGGAMTKSGRWLMRLNSEEVGERYGQIVILARPHLLSLLLSKVPERSLHPSTPVESVAADGTVTTPSGQHRADLVVAADGVRSVVRQQLWPKASPPRYSGFTAKRFTTNVLDERLPNGVWVFAPERSFGYTPLPGGRSYGWAIERAAPHGDSKDLSEYTTWRDPIPRMVANVDEGGVLRHDMYDAPMLRTFVAGRVVLLGDSAHAMQPSFGQGACQALEDAVTLARCADDLRLYDKQRRRRTQRIVRMSGWTMKSAHFTSPIAVFARDAFFRSIPRPVMRRAMGADWSWTPPPPASMVPEAARA
jgi:2-polyprenyl-6-methoxyphenol hydroxylase-like FAD-dependent oxidoreductase